MPECSRKLDPLLSHGWIQVRECGLCLLSIVGRNRRVARTAERHVWGQVLGNVVSDTRVSRQGVARAVSGYASEQPADGSMRSVLLCVKRHKVRRRAEAHDASHGV